MQCHSSETASQLNDKSHKTWGCPQKTSCICSASSIDHHKDQPSSRLVRYRLGSVYEVCTWSNLHMRIQSIDVDVYFASPCRLDGLGLLVGTPARGASLLWVRSVFIVFQRVIVFLIHPPCSSHLLALPSLLIV